MNSLVTWVTLWSKWQSPCLRLRKCAFCSDFCHSLVGQWWSTHFTSLGFNYRSVKHNETHLFWDLHLKRATKELALTTLLVSIPALDRSSKHAQKNCVEERWSGNTTTFPQYQVDPSGLFFLIACDMMSNQRFTNPILMTLTENIEL